MRTFNFIVLLALPCQVLAISDMDVLAYSDQSYTDDLPIVLSATRLAQPISEAPMAMTVIDRNMIEASGARNIPDVLRLVPGFQVGYFDGNSPVAAYHGHSGEHNTRLQVLVDGRSVYDPALYAVPWANLVIGLDDIERIEVIRGPNASTFGNNSFFAVISITTRHAIESQGHSVHIKAGSHATTDAAYTFGDQNGSLDYKVTITTQNDNGTDFLRDDTQARSLNYRMDWQTNNRNRILYQGGIKNSELGDHISIPGEDVKTGHTIDTESLFQLIKWEYLPKTDNSFSLQYYYNRLESIETSPAISYPLINARLVLLGYDPYAYVMNMSILSERHDIEFNHFLKPYDNVRLIWGSSVRQEIVQGMLDEQKLFISGARQTLELYRGFTHGEWQFSDGWLLNAGYMIEYNQISGNDRSPRLALIHHINNQHTLRLSKSKATRTPTLFEQDGSLIFRQALTSGGGGAPNYPYDEAILTTIMGRGNLDSEKISSTEIGYIGEFINNKLTLDITVFHDKTSNMLSLDKIPIPVSLPNQRELNPKTLIDTTANGLATTIKGVELTLHYRPNKHFSSYFFYSHINIDLDRYITHLDFPIVNSAPEDSGGLMLTQSWHNNVDTSLMIYRSEDFNWTDRIDNNAVHAYTKIDTRIAKHWQTAREKLTLALIGQNLLGTHFDYNTTDYQPSGAVNRYGSPQDRRVFIELGLKFN